MASLVATAIKMAGGNDRFDDTITDRLNHVTTSAILVVMATLVTTTNLVGTPIECWIPRQFKKQQVEYINNVCWVKGMYNTSFDTEFIPSARGSGRKATILYYPWVPLILLGMAFMYSIPCIIWRSFQAKSGFDVSNFVEYGFKVSSPKVKNDVRGSLLDHMTIQVERYLSHSTKSLFCQSPDSHLNSYKTTWTLSFKHIFTKTCLSRFGHKNLNYFSVLQVLVKFMYALNAIGLIFLLDVILGVNFHSYGSDILGSLVKWNIFSGGSSGGSYNPKQSKQWWNFGDLGKMLSYHQEIRFPKVTMCDFKVRILGNVINYTVQCALPTNLFNEKVFLILWFWMVMVATMNVFSLVKWTLRITIGRDRYNYIKNLLLLSGMISPKTKMAKKKFLSDGNDEASDVNDISDNNNTNNNNNSNINNSNINNSNINNSNINNNNINSNGMYNHNGHLTYGKRPLERLVKRNKTGSDNTPIVSTILTDQQINERKLLLKFVQDHLSVDGVLLIHILNQATNTIVAMEMVEKLWINFRERCENVLQQQDDWINNQRRVSQQQQQQQLAKMI